MTRPAALSEAGSDGIVMAIGPKKVPVSIESNSQGYDYTESYGIVPGDSVQKALHKLLTKLASTVATHLPGTVAGEDIEELHQMRVATRRMRAAFRAHKSYLSWEAARPHYKRLRKIGKLLGRVRDLDIFWLNLMEGWDTGGYAGVEGGEQFLKEFTPYHH